MSIKTTTTETTTPDVVLPLHPAVQRGIQLLDSMIPGWPDLIDLDRFDLSSSHYCVLGQLYREQADAENGGGYYAGLQMLGLTVAASVRYGFYVDSDEIATWDDVEADWRLAIADRQTRTTN